MNYNPYDLVPLLINNKPMSGRPYEFDSAVSDQKKMTNAFGEYVKPTKVTTLCPDCGQGMHIEVSFGEPPFQPFPISCENCNPAPPKVTDPFMNPVKTGRITPVELDPLLTPQSATQTIVREGTVADRFVVPDKLPEAKACQLVPEAVAQSRAKTTNKKTEPKPEPETVNESITIPVTLAATPFTQTAKDTKTGMAEEIDFDDQDMVE